MDNKTNCPDRTKQYLLSLQSKYREDGIQISKLTPATATTIVPSNPFRVFLSFGIIATAQVDIYYRNGEGQLVFYQSSLTPFNVTVNQNQHFLLPTFEWVAIAVNNDSITGTTLSKT